jgi:ribose transport system permease protein
METMSRQPTGAERTLAEGAVAGAAPDPTTKDRNLVATFTGALRGRPEVWAFFFLVVLCVGMALANSHFATSTNFQTVGRQSSILVVLSVGILFVLLVGGIDLSVGGSIAFISCLAANLSGSTELYVAFALAVAAAVGIGLLNGLLISIGGLSPIVVTLAIGQVLVGVALLLTVNGPILPSNPAYGELAASSVAGIPTLVIAALVCAIVGHLLLRRVSLGRYVYAVGGNEHAAWLAGVPTRAVKVAAYAIAGLFAGLAAVLLSSRVGSGDASLGQTEMLEAYAAAFIGGVGFGTGRGSVVGVALGAVILGVISNGIDLIGLNTDYQYIVSGALIVLAITFQALPERLRWGRGRA